MGLLLAIASLMREIRIEVQQTEITSPKVREGEAHSASILGLSMLTFLLVLKIRGKTGVSVFIHILLEAGVSAHEDSAKHGESMKQ